MFRLIVCLVFFLLSLLTVVPIPAKELWYFGIAVTEFPWVWIFFTLLLLLWGLLGRKYQMPAIAVCVASLVFFCSPIYRAYSIGHELDAHLQKAFGDIPTPEGQHRNKPFAALQMVRGIGAKPLPYTTHEYAVHTGAKLSLNLYKSVLPGKRPCLLVVHGGSWKKGSNAELPDVDWYFAKAGYQVATINYRLAPQYKSPAPQEDVRDAIALLKANAVELEIDSSAFVLMGRSAGGQIVLTAAYSLHDPAIKGVISFYGPTDMYWAYSHPDNPLVMHSQQVMEDFFGGSPERAPQAYTEGSPTHNVDAGTVPTLLVHGGNDAHVHYEEALLLKAKLDEYKVPNMLLGLPWATHGCEYSLNGPSGQLAVYAEERFMQKVTRDKGR